MRAGWFWIGEPGRRRLQLLGRGAGSGTVTYTDGTTQSFTLSLADWWANAAAPGGDILATVPYMNTSNGQTDQKISVYAVLPSRAAGQEGMERYPRLATHAGWLGAGPVAALARSRCQVAGQASPFA